MSTFSLFNSSFMTAVFLESLMSCRLAEKPVIIVRTFQHLSFKTGLFLIISFVVAWCHGSSLLIGWSLIPMHPMRMTDRGGTAPYWLGAAQLEAGNNCPVRSEDLTSSGATPGA